MKRRYVFALGTLLALASVFMILLRAGYPHHRELALALYALGGAMIVATFFMKRDTAPVWRFMARLSTPAFSAISLALIGYALYVIFPVKENEFLNHDLPALQAVILEDESHAARLIVGLERIWSDTAVLPLAGRDYPLLSPADRAEILDRWGVYLDHAVALDRLTFRHRHFYQINYLRHPAENLRSFLTAYASFLANVQNGHRLRDFVGESAGLEGMLNEARPELGISGGNYDRLMRGLTHAETLLLLNAGRANLAFLERSGVALTDLDRALVDHCRGAYKDVLRRLGTEPEIFADNPLNVYEQTTFRIWFPFQKEVSEAMGDLRTTRRPNLISAEQAAATRGRLEPGDIIIERRNWYLSNIGLPGFWPHAALYTGRLEDLDAFFAGEPALGGMTFREFLRTKYPAVHEGYLHPKHGDPPSVIEAVSEGVSLHAWEESAAGDYVCVMRPRLSKSERLAAILRAFGYFGRPYDFNFDFVSDNALVCSEVVYKAYEGALSFNLETTAGRLVLAPNNIIAKFDMEYDSPARQLDFVLFLDGIERDHRAYERTAAELRNSWKRPKWDIAQQ